MNGSVSFDESLNATSYTLYRIEPDGTYSAIATAERPPIAFTVPDDTTFFAGAVTASNTVGESQPTEPAYWNAPAPDAIEIDVPPNTPINIQINISP